MFGLENRKKGKTASLLFDLEKEIQDPEKLKKYQLYLEERLQQIKQALQGGAAKEDFEQFGILLHAFTSIQKVLARCVAQKGL